MSSIFERINAQARANGDAMRAATSKALGHTDCPPDWWRDAELWRGFGGVAQSGTEALAFSALLSSSLKRPQAKEQTDRDDAAASDFEENYALLLEIERAQAGMHTSSTSAFFEENKEGAQTFTLTEFVYLDYQIVEVRHRPVPVASRSYHSDDQGFYERQRQKRKNPQGKGLKHPRGRIYQDGELVLDAA